MSTAEIALNTPRSDTSVDATSHKGLEGLPKHVELMCLMISSAKALASGLWPKTLLTVPLAFSNCPLVPHPRPLT